MRKFLIYIILWIFSIVKIKNIWFYFGETNEGKFENVPKPSIFNNYNNLLFYEKKQLISKNNYKKIKEENDNNNFISNNTNEKNKLEKQSEKIENKLLESKIGLYNAGGSCYMASIIQILIHSKKFLDIFLNIKNNDPNSLSRLFYNFIKEIATTSKNNIEIQNFAQKFNKFNYKFNGCQGNNPMTFFNEFIKQIAEESNKKILNLFKGKKSIIFDGMPELNYDEDFIFYLVLLDKNHIKLKDIIYEEKKMEDNKTKIIEKIIYKPEIFIINLEIEDIEYNFEEQIYLEDDKGNYVEYNLKAINRYTDYHSIA